MLKDKSLLSNKNVYDLKSIIIDEKNSIHSVPANKEWLNSIYTFNKNYNKTLPIADNVVNSLLKDYFNIDTLINGKKSSILTILAKRKSLDKIIASKAEIKHTNDKINLTVYIYNRHKLTLLNNIYNFYKPNKLEIGAFKPYALNSFFFIAKKKLIERKKNITLILNNLKKRIALPLFIDLSSFDYNLNKYEKQLYEQYRDMLYEHRALYLYYINALAFNNNKFKDWFLLNLKNKISLLYNKKVQLNIVNQKYHYLNSDIFVEALATKVRDRNNNISVEMKKAFNNIAIPQYKSNYSLINNFLLDNINNIHTSISINNESKDLEKKIYDSIRYKRVHGIRLEAAGRLTKRLTAARSLSKLNYSGSLKNLDVLYRAESSLMLRGNIKPNIQYTNVNSKTRNGAFGLKGWISSH